MRRKAAVLGGMLYWTLLALTLPVLGQSATAPAPATVPTVAVNEVLRRGQQLEIEHRWGDALANYEDAIREHPEDRTLEQRFELARLHYDLGRRYNDSTFQDSLKRLSLNEALDLYNDVLVKIFTHYVETPDWKDLVGRGLMNLEVALSEPAFVERNVPRASGAALADFRRELHATLDARSIGSRSEVRDAVTYAAELAQARLGMSPTAVVLEFLCGATNSLDPYSAYLTPGQLAEVYSQIEGNFVGLGVELKANSGALLIVRVIPNSPAQRSGLTAGDNIVAVNGQFTRNYSTDQAANLLQGEAGSWVDVTVQSPRQEPRTVRIQRQRVDVPSIDEARIIDGARGVAYLRLVCFQKNTSRELDAALWQLHRDGMRSLVVDLRGNPGGLLPAAVDVVDKFVDRGVIVTTRGRNAQEDFTYTAREEGTWHMPLVLIIDQDSASAAEIFAGAIRDHHRGTLVGVRSYGKGSVQGIFPLSFANAGVRLTTAKFFSPAGRPFARVGVEPDLLVHRVAHPLSGTGLPATGPAEDPMLTAAIQVAAENDRRR